MSVREMRRRGASKPHPLRCNCGKWYSPTEADAKRLRREVEDFKGHSSEVRFYECPFGGHHWTQMV